MQFKRAKKKVNEEKNGGNRICKCKVEMKELEKKMDKVIMMVEDIVKWVSEEKEREEKKKRKGTER